MYKHLFLEGNIQEGKSTLIRKLLHPYMHFTGGFASQRLTNKEDITVGFRIGPAEGTPLTAPLENYISDSGVHITDHILQTLKPGNGIFRISDTSGKALKFPEVFDNEGVRYLTENEGKKIILLDEIGGVELLNEKFRKTLYAVLNSDIPCIGVIKQEKKADHMSRTAGYSKSVVYYNKELRHKVTQEYSGKILNFKRGDSTVESETENFLCRIFTTK